MSWQSLETGAHHGSLVGSVLVPPKQRQTGDGNGEPFDYGYLWWVGEDLLGHRWFDSGEAGQLVLVIPDLHVVVAVSPADDSNAVRKAFDALIAELIVKPFG
jgi:CubicO group peptidase (beta-lactamase class C family)